MKRWMMGGAAAAAALAGAAVAAQAQDRGPDRGPHASFGPGGGRHARLSPEDRTAFAEARIAGLRAGLRLTPDQDKLWPPVEEAIRALARQRQEARAARRERFASFGQGGERDMVGELRASADRQAASAEAVRRLADASEPLYRSLDDAQKRRLGILSRGLVRMEERGPGRGNGGPGGPREGRGER